MELTDQQYEQVIRYVEGEMQAEERQAFEALLLQDRDLAEEVESYREVRSMGIAIEQKLNSLHQLTIEAKDEKAMRLLQQAREDWERDQEVGIADKGYGRVEGMYTQRWLAAAVLVGVLCLGGVLWWYLEQREAGKPAIAEKQKVMVAIKTDTSAFRNTVPPVQDTTPATNLGQKDKNDKAIQEEKPVQLDHAKREAVYAHNFQPDAVPEEQPEVLQDAFVSYNEGEYEKAIAAIKKLKPAPVIRGEETEEELTGFYVHYYNAQSYMALDSIEKAIIELKKAETSDRFLQSKKQWYLALAYLKTGDLQRAEQMLKQLAGNKQAGTYKQKAHVLLKELSGKVVK